MIKYVGKWNWIERMDNTFLGIGVSIIIGVIVNIITSQGFKINNWELYEWVVVCFAVIVGLLCRAILYKIEFIALCKMVRENIIIKRLGKIKNAEERIDAQEIAMVKEEEIYNKTKDSYPVFYVRYNCCLILACFIFVIASVLLVRKTNLEVNKKDIEIMNKNKQLEDISHSLQEFRSSINGKYDSVALELKNLSEEMNRCICKKK